MAFQIELREMAAKQIARTRRPHPPAHRPGQRGVSEALAQENLQGVDRTAFLAAAAQTIRRVLIDHARKKRSPRHGGDQDRVTLSAAASAADEPPVDLHDLNDALEKLRHKSERMYNVVIYRYFAGMTMGEIAAALGLGLRTVEEDWAFAKAWLRRELSR